MKPNTQPSGTCFVRALPLLLFSFAALTDHQILAESQPTNSISDVHAAKSVEISNRTNAVKILTNAPNAALLQTNIALPGFGAISADQFIAYDELFAVLRDKYPVSPGHCLIVARRPAPRFKDLTSEEKNRLIFWIDWTQKNLTETLRPIPDAFNLGLNDGQAAGQTIQQFHFHVIPRFFGDVADPRGGVRYVIPEKARYWQKP